MSLACIGFDDILVERGFTAQVSRVTMAGRMEKMAR
jgi:hypothetical protein